MYIVDKTACYTWYVGIVQYNVCIKSVIKAVVLDVNKILKTRILESP